MNAKSIAKKVLPILLTITLIVLIVIVSTSISNNNKKAPKISEGDKAYLQMSEKINELEYNYLVTRDQLYNKLKTGIGLSSAITMINKDLLKDAKNDEGISFWDLVKDEDIEKSIEEAVYGKDADISKLTAEKKEEKIKDFLDTMKTGYGYKVANGLDSIDILNHYRLVNAKKEYARYILLKEIKEAKDKEPIFSDDVIEDYYDSNYNKNFWALIIPFDSEKSAIRALQQLGVAIDSSDDLWESVKVEEEVITEGEGDDKTTTGTGNYKTVTGDPLSTKEVIDTFLNLYNLVYGYKKQNLIQGNYEIKTTTGGKKYYEIIDKNCDYVIVELTDEFKKIKELSADLKVIIEDALTEETTSQALSLIEDIREEINICLEKIVDTTALDEAISSLEKLRKAIDPEDEDKTGPKDIFDEFMKKIDKYEEKTYIFNFEKEDSLFSYTYSDLYDYDSNLPSKIRNNYTTYTPFVSINDDANWFSVDAVSSSPCYYFILKLKQTDPITLTEARDEIIDALTEDKLDENYIETKMAELRNEYKIIIYDKEIQTYYIEALKSYDVKFKKSNKKNKTLIASVEKGSFKKEYSADNLFDYMERTSGLATAVSEIAFQRLLNNTLFNKYKDYSTGKWLGEEGEEKKKEIIAQIEEQRLYFLSGGYLSYGYDPSTMSWEDFLYQVNGATDEFNLADLLVYSTVASEYIAKTIEFLKVDGEGIDLDFVMSYEDALASPGWQLLKERMNDMLVDYLNANGEHLLVCVYETVNDALNGVTPLDPEDWPEGASQMAEKFIADINKYIDYQEGTIASKLQALVSAFKDAPYSVKDENGKYVTIIDSDNVKYKYFLETAEYEIDLAKYKSAGLSIKYENLGTITAGQMVEAFENAVREIWESDIAQEVTDKITIYDEAIQTEFGYHLYVNLASLDVTKYDSLVVDEKGELIKVDENGTEVNKTEKALLPSLYEIRLYVLKEALNNVDVTDLSDEEIKALGKKIDEIEELLSNEAISSVTTYYTEIFAKFTDSYFSSVIQQKDVLRIIEKPDSRALLNSNNYNLTELVDMIKLNNEITYKSNIKYLKAGDEDLFDITKEFIK